MPKHTFRAFLLLRAIVGFPMVFLGIGFSRLGGWIAKRGLGICPSDCRDSLTYNSPLFLPAGYTRW